jgi:hypothetical protein
MIEEGKQRLEKQKAKGKAIKLPGLFRRLYDFIRSSGARNDIPPPPQEHTGKQ